MGLWRAASGLLLALALLPAYTDDVSSSPAGPCSAAGCRQSMTIRWTRWLPEQHRPASQCWIADSCPPNSFSPTLRRGRGPRQAEPHGPGPCLYQTSSDAALSDGFQVPCASPGTLSVPCLCSNVTHLLPSQLGGEAICCSGQGCRFPSIVPRLQISSSPWYMQQACAFRWNCRHALSQSCSGFYRESDCTRDVY